MFFLVFRFLMLSLSVFNIYEKILAIKRSSLVEKTEKCYVYKENSLVGLTLGNRGLFFCKLSHMSFIGRAIK
jgi:hypothetical protein